MASAINLGDTVSGRYHDVPFTGEAYAVDGSCNLYVRMEEPLTVYGVSRSVLSIPFYSEERASLRVVACPIQRPEVFDAPADLLGGCYVR